MSSPLGELPWALLLLAGPLLVLSAELYSVLCVSFSSVSGSESKCGSRGNISDFGGLLLLENSTIRKGQNVH